jgi:hypothetical protein
MVASPTIPSSRFAIAFTPEHYRSDDLIGNLWGCFYKLKRSPRQSPPQRRSWVFGFGVVPRHLSLASAEAGVAEETRAADRLGRFECAGSPIRRPAMRLSVAKRTRRPTCARSGQRLSPKRRSMVDRRSPTRRPFWELAFRRVEAHYGYRAVPKHRCTPQVEHEWPRGADRSLPEWH